MTRILQFRRRTTQRLDVAALYSQYAGLVQRRVMRFFTEDEAEEVVHEIFLKVIEQADGFRAEASPSTWLYALTTNHCLNRLRDRDRRARSLALNKDLPWLQRGRSGNPEATLFLEQLWQSLDPELATIGMYYFVDGMSHGEIAQAVGVSRRTIGNRLDTLRQRAVEAAGQRTSA